MNRILCLCGTVVSELSFHPIVAFLLLIPSLCPAQDAKPPAEELKPASTVTTEDKAIVVGQLIRRVDPTYPKDARKRKLEGQVILKATIEQDGSVSNVSIVSGDVLLAESAVDAVREWKFKPYMQNGVPIQVLQNLSFTFAKDKKFAELDPSLPAPVPTSEMNVPVSGSQRAAAAFRLGGGITAPKAIFAPDPAYDKEARKEKYQGRCVLSMIVGTDGIPRDIKVVRAIGKGLDEKAVEAVSKWKFEPAMKDGNPVAVLINVEVNFRLY